MSELNALFRQRIGIPETEEITFETLDRVLEKTAQSIPFENFCIVDNKTYDIAKDSLINKMLVKKEGGLCYELNSLLYFFLVENGFNAALTRGVVYKHDTGHFLSLGRTHVTILVTSENETYLVDTGFGGNLPLTPVPLSGRTVSSANGDFQIKRRKTEYGDYVLEMKLKHKHADWTIGYAFDSGKTVADVSEFNEIQTIIAGHQESPFNKNRLITRRTGTGNMTLTDTSFTQWEGGIVKKEQIDGVRFKDLLRRHFGL